MFEKVLKVLKHLRRQGTPMGAHKRPPECPFTPKRVWVASFFSQTIRERFSSESLGKEFLRSLFVDLDALSRTCCPGTTASLVMHRARLPVHGPGGRAVELVDQGVLQDGHRRREVLLHA